MGPDELLAGFERANRRSYSPRSIAKRLARSPVQLPWALPLNLAHAAALRRRAAPLAGLRGEGPRQRQAAPAWTGAHAAGGASRSGGSPG